jgi:hypothetical protein
MPTSANLKAWHGYLSIRIAKTVTHGGRSNTSTRPMTVCARRPISPAQTLNTKRAGLRRRNGRIYGAQLTSLNVNLGDARIALLMGRPRTPCIAVSLHARQTAQMEAAPLPAGRKEAPTAAAVLKAKNVQFSARIAPQRVRAEVTHEATIRGGDALSGFNGRSNGRVVLHHDSINWGRELLQPEFWVNRNRCSKPPPLTDPQRRRAEGARHPRRCSPRLVGHVRPGVSTFARWREVATRTRPHRDQTAARPAGPV